MLPGLVSKAFKDSMKIVPIQSGIRKTGILPLNPETVHKSLPLFVQTPEQPQSSEPADSQPLLKTEQQPPAPSSDPQSQVPEISPMTIFLLLIPIEKHQSTFMTLEQQQKLSELLFE